MKKEGRSFKRIVQSLPRTAIIFFIFGVLAFFMHVLCLFSSETADFLMATLGSTVRTVLGAVGGVIPFSIAELLVVGLPIWVLLLLLLVRLYLRRGGSWVRATALFLSFLPLLYALFVFSLGFGYLTTPLDEKIGLSTEEKISADELYKTGVWLKEKASEEIPHIAFSETGESQMMLSKREMNTALAEAFGTLEKKYSFLSARVAPAKAIVLSKPMAYTGIVGVYSFFTGESNVCTYFPDYSTVYTAAHELSHASGIAREDEANFIAFLALLESDEPYLRYAAYVNLLQYTLNALYQADKTLHRELQALLPNEILGEYRAYSRAFDSVGEHPLRDIAESVNDAYLSGVGTEGTVSYGLVVRYAVAYVKTK